MYTAVLCFALGLALLVQSWVLVGLFVALLVAILILLPVEERQLATAYGRAYVPYRQRVRALVPFIY